MCNISTIIQDFNVCFYEKDHNLNMNRNLPLSMSPYGFSATRVPLVKCDQAYCGEDTFSRVHMFTFRRVVRLQSGLKRWAATLLWPKILPKIELKNIAYLQGYFVYQLYFQLQRTLHSSIKSVNMGLGRMVLVWKLLPSEFLSNSTVDRWTDGLSQTVYSLKN